MVAESTPTGPLAHMSVEEYFAYDEAHPDARFEYINGKVSMMAGGTNAHARVTSNMDNILATALEKTDCAVFSSDARVVVSHAVYFYPDLSVSCDPQDLRETQGVRAPRLIVEVLSPSTESFDRGNKFYFYQTNPTLEEYVLVESRRQWIEVFHRVGQKIWQWQGYGPEEQVTLARLGITFNVADVYRKVVFAEE